jgi:hypothetical protein
MNRTQSPIKAPPAIAPTVLGVRAKKPGPPPRADFETVWETDDRQIDVTLSCGPKKEAEVAVHVAPDTFLIASSVGDLDEVVDILLRSRISAVRYKVGQDAPSDEGFELQKAIDAVFELIDKAKEALRAGNTKKALGVLEGAEKLDIAILLEEAK